MRLKSGNKRTLILNSANGVIGEDVRNDLNGSNISSSMGSSSSSSSSNSSNLSGVGMDDLDVDSGDDEIDVGTNADSIGFSNHHSDHQSNSNGTHLSAALTGMNNDHQFGASSIQQSSQQQSGQQHQHQSNSSMSEADRKRAHHNALERKRRDHIKDSFHTLRDAIPNIKGEKVSTSRAQILKAATDYIKLMRNRNIDFQHDIDSLKKQNNDIENQIRQLEKAKQSVSMKHQNHLQQQSTLNGTYEILNVKNEPNTTINISSAANSVMIQDNQMDLKEGILDETINSTSTPTSITTTQVAANGTQMPTNVLVINNNRQITTTPLLTTGNTAANGKKFKTIINSNGTINKSSLNIINLANNYLQHATTAAAQINAATTAPTTTAITVNSSSSNSSLANNIKDNGDFI